MIHADLFELQDVATGSFFAVRYLQERGPSRYAPIWVDPDAAGGWRHEREVGWAKEADLERMLTRDFDGRPDPDRVIWHVQIPVIMTWEWDPKSLDRHWKAADPGFYDMIVRKVRRPCCECCGGNPDGRHRGRRPIQRAGDGTYRCEKHVGRNPCAVEGCGKTRAQSYPSSDNYLCGTHWKMVPHPLKLVYRRLWRLAKKNQRRRVGDDQGWTEALNARYWRNWNRMIRAARLAVRPPPAPAEIVAESGPPPAALVAELERIGL